MKSTICIFLATIMIALCFASCASNIPEEPATTAVENHSYVNPVGGTAPAPVNVETTEGQTLPIEYIETVNNVEIVLSSYYVYGNTVAKIEDISLEDDGFSVRADGFANVRILGIGKKSDDMKIAYTGYNAEGEIVRKSYMLVPLKDAKEGEIVADRRFDFPRDCVKLVFSNYVEEAE